MFQQLAVESQLRGGMSPLLECQTRGMETVIEHMNYIPDGLRG
jgi:hypothetical protein